MKKALLTTILTSSFVAPAFSAFPASDMNNDGQLENREVSSNMRLNHSQRYNDQHAQVTEQASAQEQSSNGAEKQHLGGVKSESDKPHMLGQPITKEVEKEQGNDSSADDSDDENPNLANLATPEPRNIRNNLQISDQDRSLNRQMMLNGPQGGFQSTEPRGIGGSRANF